MMAPFIVSELELKHWRFLIVSVSTNIDNEGKTMQLSAQMLSLKSALEAIDERKNYIIPATLVWYQTD